MELSHLLNILTKLKLMKILNGYGYGIYEIRYMLELKRNLTDNNELFCDLCENKCMNLQYINKSYTEEEISQLQAFALAQKQMDIARNTVRNHQDELNILKSLIIAIISSFKVGPKLFKSSLTLVKCSKLGTIKGDSM